MSYLLSHLNFSSPSNCLFSCCIVSKYLVSINWSSVINNIYSSALKTFSLVKLNNKNLLSKKLISLLRSSVCWGTQHSSLLINTSLISSLKNRVHSLLSHLTLNLTTLACNLPLPHPTRAASSIISLPPPGNHVYSCPQRTSTFALRKKSLFNMSDHWESEVL